MEGEVNGQIPDDFMADASKRLSSLRFSPDSKTFQVLDQLQLPHKREYINIRNVHDAFNVIKSMQVRGAPLIAVVGALGLYSELLSFESGSTENLMYFVQTKADYLISSRPTAINLQNAMNDICAATECHGDLQSKLKHVRSACLKIYNEEQEENRRLVWNGFQEMHTILKKKKKAKLSVMTICNTGSLATCSWGTALGVIRALHEYDRLDMVYVLETRPYNQGVRLTATELLHGQVPFKLITDSMAACAMRQYDVDAVLVGADQVALNGDFANKVGTYMLAVLAKYHKIPFYPVVPRPTINTSREDGNNIPIEVRPAAEMLQVNGVSIGHPSTPVWNPAFDVTPGTLVTKIITDFGNFTSSELREAVVQVSDC